MSQSDFNISLRSELREMVEQAVASGNYSSPSEVIDEALAQWRLQHLAEHQFERLRRAWDQGLASGDAQPFDPDLVLAAAGMRRTDQH